MIEYFELKSRLENSEDGLECLPAAMAMATSVFDRSGISLSEAMEASGYVHGKETWPYRMLSWFSRNGYDVIHIDAMDADLFAADPKAELVRSGFDSETIEYFVSITDFAAEAKAIFECNESGVGFSKNLPVSKDIVTALEDGWLPILTLDAGVLMDQDLEGYQGHMVLVTGRLSSESKFIVQDSGPPAHWDWKVPEDRIFRALRTPTASSGTVTLVRKSRPN